MKKQTILILLSILLVSLAACGGNSNKESFFTEEKPGKKPKVKNQVDIDRVWRASLGKSIESGAIALSPELRGDHIYAAATNGRAYKIDVSNGKTVWEKKFKDLTITAGVGSGDGLVLFGTSEGIIYALSQSDGAVQWQTQLSTEILATPAVNSGVVVVRTADGKVYGLSSYDGDVKWTIGRPLPKLTLRGDSKPLLFQGIAFIGFPDGSLVAVSAENGRALWDIPIAFSRGTNDIDRLVDIDTSPLLVGDNLYVTSYQEVTHALNIPQKKIDWSVDISSYHALAFDSLYLYLTDKLGVVHKINRSNGDKEWSQDGLKLYSVSAPMSVGPFVMVSDGDGDIYVLDKRDGRYLATQGLGAKGVVGDPVSSSDTVYFIDTDGDLQAISVSVK